MHQTLKENLSSRYFEAANRLRPKNARRRIVAYVESYDDVLFWRTLLSNYEDSTRYFEVMLPSHNTLERGKRSVLMNLLYSKVGQNMIACVDADYDYLIQGATETSRNIISNPYIFHTYAYAIENMQCYAPSLHNVCVMVTLNDHAIFNFTSFMREYSVAVFPLFVWSIWFYRSTSYGRFTISDFNKSIELGGFDMNHPEIAIENLCDKVRRKINWLKQRNPRAKESWLSVKADIIRLGVTPETTYLYIKGHYIFDKVVMPIMSKVCSALIRERESEIRRQAVHSTQMRNELSCYTHSIQDISQMLKKNTGYVISPPFRLLQQDIERFLGSDAHGGQTV